MKRHVDAAATYVIAALAFALSYSKLVELASRAGYGATMAHAWPLIVDGLAVMAARAVLRLADGRWYAWALLVAGTAVSILAAVTNAVVPPGPLPPAATAAVTIVPALCLPLALHLARKMQGATDPGGVAAESLTNAVETTTVGAAVLEQRGSHETAVVAPTVAPDPVRDDGLRPGEFSEQAKTEALRLVATGLSQREAGRRIGTSGNTVRRWLAQAQGVA